MTRVLVCGGREYWERARVYSALDRAHAKRVITLIIEGGARGADRLGRDWAKANDVPFETYHAQWLKYKLGAGPLRNQRMLVEGKPDLVVAFPGNTGTADMVRRAEAAGVKVWRPYKA